MNKKYIYECLLNIIDKEDIKLDEPMKKHQITSMILISMEI